MSTFAAGAASWINGAIAIGVALTCIGIADRIVRGTRCIVRLGVLGMFAGALLHIFGGVWEFDEWANTVFLGGVLVYLLGNMRAPAAVPSPAWATRLAWAVTAIVLSTLGAAFSSAVIAQL